MWPCLHDCILSDCYWMPVCCMYYYYSQCASTTIDARHITLPNLFVVILLLVNAACVSRLRYRTRAAVLVCRVAGVCCTQISSLPCCCFIVINASQDTSFDIEIHFQKLWKKYNVTIIALSALPILYSFARVTRFDHHYVRCWKCMKLYKVGVVQRFKCYTHIEYISVSIYKKKAWFDEYSWDWFNNVDQYAQSKRSSAEKFLGLVE